MFAALVAVVVLVGPFFRSADLLGLLLHHDFVLRRQLVIWHDGRPGSSGRFLSTQLLQTIHFALSPQGIYTLHDLLYLHFGRFRNILSRESNESQP